MAALHGISSVSLNFSTAKLVIEHTIPIDNIIRVIDEAGYGVKQLGLGQKQNKSFCQPNIKAILTIVSSTFLAVAFLLSFLGVEEKLIIPLYLLTMVSGGYYIGRSAFYSAKALTFDMNFLMSVAAIGAIFIGEWVEGATVVVLFAIGNTLQTYTMDKTRKSIESLMDLSPKEALVVRNGVEVSLPVEEILVGDLIIIKPGAKIPMDGIVQSGSSFVNQAPITGESLPVEKIAGSEVFAGTINEKGSLEVKVTKLVEDTTLAKIIHLVEEAQSQKAPSQQFVDKFSTYYTPVVIVLAIAIAVLPSLLFGLPFNQWFYKALVLLVIACPCALVISTPVSIVSAIGNAARQGVLIKGGAYLEEAGALKAVAFDKTGTLTTGKPEVCEVRVLDSFLSETELIEIAATIELRSQHPIATAIIDYAKQNSISIKIGSDFKALDGMGAQALVDSNTYYIGNLRLFNELKLPINAALKEEVTGFQKLGQTVMLVGTSAKVLGLISVADKIRTESLLAITELKKSGIEKVIMLTGDNAGTAKMVGEKLGVDEIRSELLPTDKLTTVKELLAKHGKVAMVGDGVNDAPALAASTVGISMGVAGTDTALETADIALMADDLAKLPFTIKLSRKALAIIKQNIAFSLVVKALFIALTFMGITNLWLAVFADTGAAIIVILNGMRLLAVRP